MLLKEIIHLPQDDNQAAVRRAEDVKVVLFLNPVILGTRAARCGSVSFLSAYVGMWGSLTKYSLPEHLTADD